MSKLVSYFHNYDKVFENAVLCDLTAAEQLPLWFRSTSYGKATLALLSGGLRMQVFCAGKDLFVNYVRARDSIQILQSYHETMVDNTPWAACAVCIMNDYAVVR